MKLEKTSFALAIIEDKKEIREGLNDFFSLQPSVNSIKVFSDMESFFRELDKGYNPEIILSDIGLPGMDGINGIKIISQRLPDADVIMLTVFMDSVKIFNALCAGATGYMLKGTPMSEVMNAIEVIRSGGSYMSPSIARQVVEHFKTPAKSANERLTEKEREVIKYLLDGLTYKLIAEKLFISVDGVRFRIKSIYEKLQVNSRSEIMSKALKGEI
jgi:DNA-binding NarL/FixJ family response regulator